MLDVPHQEAQEAPCLVDHTMNPRDFADSSNDCEVDGDDLDEVGKADDAVSE